MILTDEWIKENHEKKYKWFLGNQDAILFVNDLFYCIEAWDDLIDKDKDISDKRINDAFIKLIFNLPSNNWFIDNRYYYLPLLMTCSNAFIDANKLQTNPQEHLRNIAFHIRNMGIEIHIATAFLTGGIDHMMNVSQDIREWFAFEKFDEWEYI